MTQAAPSFTARKVPDDLVRLRRHAALVRSLLDELDRILPVASATPRSDAALGIHQQLVEELGRVGCRLLECAATLSEMVVDVPVASQALDGSTGFPVLEDRHAFAKRMNGVIA